jgi:transcriptional regulator with XRE-family HTH domain
MEGECPLDEPGERLRALRRAKEISQRHLAELSGVDQSVVSRLERGADTHWANWKRLFSSLGYDVVLRPEPYGEDDLEDFLQDGARQRKEKMENGRMARWG